MDDKLNVEKNIHKTADRVAAPESEFLAANRSYREKARADAEKRRMRREIKERREASRSEFFQRNSSKTIVALSLLLVIAVAAAGYFFWSAHNLRGEVQDGAGAELNWKVINSDQDKLSGLAAEFLIGISTFSNTETSADYSKANAAIKNLTTPDFKKISEIELQKQVKGRKEQLLSQIAMVKRAAIIERTETTATALLFFDVLLKSPKIAQQYPDGTIYSTRMELKLVKLGNDWKVGALSQPV